MHVRVESRLDPRGVRTLDSIDLGGRVVAVAEVVDRWPGEDYVYFKVWGGDGNLYILRLDETSADWELTMFWRARAEAPPAGIVPPRTVSAATPRPR